MNLFLNNFHFVRPYWLLAIFALFFVLWLLRKHRFHQSPWNKFLPSHLSQVLIEGAANANSHTNNKALSDKGLLIKPLIIGLLSIVALAGPVWQKLPQPVYQTERGSVLIMDMSYSMYATDIKPNRLTRARFKAVDLLNKINEGDTGLIAYAGDAFVISPLTQDIKNIELLLPSLTPEIMPELGSNPLAALTLAHEMLLNAGHLNGDIYWFTDDVDNSELTDIYDWTNEFGHQLNILGVGSVNGAPITLPSGELLKDNSGAIIVPRLPNTKLQSLASRGHGNYQTISNDDSDIDKLISSDPLLENNKKNQQESQQTGDQWQEQGAWLLLLALPLILSYFRRGGAILILPFSCLPLLLLLSFTAISTTAFAADKNENTAKPNTSSIAQTSQKIWQDLWQTKDQQAQQQYNQKNYQDAAQQFDNSQWQGSAHYKAGDYQAALEAFQKGEQATSADSLYNQGNALAQLQQYEKAIESYENALKKNPDMQDAKDNIEKIKQQQKEQEQQQDQQSKDDKSKDQESDDQKNQEQNSQDSKDQEQNSQDSEQQEQQSQDQQNQQQSDDSQQQKDGEGEPKESDEQQQSKPEDANKEQQDKKAEQEKQQQEQKNAQQQEQQSGEQDKEKTAAQIAQEQQAKETEQKHQQLLNKVTDDPYLLLRNKMQLEYQKRKQNGSSQGVKKKW